MQSLIEFYRLYMKLRRDKVRHEILAWWISYIWWLDAVSWGLGAFKKAISLCWRTMDGCSDSESKLRMGLDSKSNTGEEA